MTDLALRPRSSTELVDAAFQVFRRTPVQFIVAAALVYVPWLVIQLVFNLEITPNQLPGFDVLAVNFLAGIVVYVLLGGVITLLARDAYFDQQPDVAAAFKTVGARILPLLGTSLFVLLATAVGFVVFLVGSLYPLARFFAARQTVVLENAGVSTALSRSSTLSDQLKGHVLATLFLAGLLSFAVMFGSTLIGGLLPSRVLMRTVVTIVAVCVKPFFSIAETLLYYDTRIRKEAFDIEYLANAADALTPPPKMAL
jgi:hypothetical protein